MRLKIVSKGRA